MQAKKWANEFEVGKDKNLISNQDPVFADYFEDWYKRYKAPGKSNNTKNRYAHIYQLLKETFGNTKLSKMSRNKYQDFLNGYGKYHAKDTVQKTNGTIRSCVKDAVSDGLVSIILTDKINLTRNEDETREMEYLNFKQVQQLKTLLLKDIKPSYVSRYMPLTNYLYCHETGRDKSFKLRRYRL